MTTTDYQTRYRDLRGALAALDPRTVAAAVGTGMLDQLGAATRETQTLLSRVGAAEHALDPDRFHPGVKTSDDQAAVTDVTARILAAMGDRPPWRFCSHLRRTPAQPAQIRLPLRRVDCNRCAATWRTPPADEADRCDLCGSRGNTSFWPVRFALTHWLVLGDMCGGCAEAILPTVGATP